MLEVIGIQGEEILLTGTEELHIGSEVESTIGPDESGRVFICSTSIDGIYTFGCEQLVAEWLGKKRGYIWPCRPSVINFLLNKRLIAAKYQQPKTLQTILCAIDYDTLDSILDKAKYCITGPENMSSIDLLYKVTQINAGDKHNIKQGETSFEN